MSDVSCPYCGYEQAINHDDGYGFEEDKLHEQECYACEKNFSYQTSILYYYEVKRAECLNGGQHTWREVVHYPKMWDWKRCEQCGKEEKVFINKLEA